MDKTELAKYETKITQNGKYTIEKKYLNGELIEHKEWFYKVYTMTGEKGLSISSEQYENIKKLLNDPNVRFVEIKNTLIAVHQITSIEKEVSNIFIFPVKEEEIEVVDLDNIK